MHRRRVCKALDHAAVRELVEAEAFAAQRGKSLNTVITIHPKLLANYPNDVGQWLPGFLLNKLRIWCVRDCGFGYFAIWVRENYEGDRREHIHILISVPEGQRAALDDALRRWLVGKDGQHGADNVVKVGQPEYSRDPYGRRTSKALTYVLKQMTPQARFALERRVRRETKSRDDDAPVASVLGKRWGVSRSLNRRTRATFWKGTTNRKAASGTTALGTKRRTA